ncbi:glycoside hydrolase family 88 protein [Aureibaculum sp. A20]|uniref:Glycoside hydrolase family 88 protein n=1 Tax=Aureibaculum flavum TaxID=2795986 RepID=A0ABS0WNH2_9FLAO|nr:glycoside hydrolase family 88 protein [Aureibaculum flavum]MBJ2173525.1 glycoside hydrolase family 88 protein [Aureibaculum flavum]
MNNNKWVLIIAIIFSLTNCKDAKKKDTIATTIETKEDLINRVFTFSEKQYDSLIHRIENNKPLLQPRGITEEGELRLKPFQDWTSGFFPGSLWYIYEYNHSDKWKDYAMKFTVALDSVKYITNSHDVGFMLECSYGNGYMATKDKNYEEVLVKGARSLITRYRPEIGVIQSWDTTPDMGWISERGWDVPVIVDNMMNLELLYKAFEFTKDSTFYNVATKHALTTLKNHFRDDYSSFHVVDYESKTGEVRSKQTAQGYSDPSSWARGQAWGLYGFTQTYENTKDTIFLNQAKGIANYIMESKKVPEDLIPFWDYDAPKIPNEPRDASAAAITASALLSLQQYVPEKSVAMKSYAEKIIRRLSTPDYLANFGQNQGFLLKHSVGNIHTGEENDKPLNYADYYYLEALTKWKKVD